MSTLRPAIVTQVPRNWSRELLPKVGEQIEGSPRQKWEALNAATMPQIGGDIDLQLVEQTSEAFDVNKYWVPIRGFFRQPELGGGWPYKRST